MGAWSRLPQTRTNTVLLVVAQQMTKDLAACTHGGSQVRVLMDPQGRTARHYNALWQPRAYAWDEQGKLTYVQPVTTPDPQGPLQVEALWRGLGVGSPGQQPG